MSNTLKTLLIDALEALVELHHDDPIMLAQIDAELAGRSSRQRNSALRARIQALISSRTLTEPQAPTPLITPTSMPCQRAYRDAPIAYPEHFMGSAFETMRQKLLDISGSRSRLLNLDQTSRAFVRVVDELPDELAKRLLSEQSMQLTPVPEPTLDELMAHGYVQWDDAQGKYLQNKKPPEAKEWAGLLGIDHQYTLPMPDARAQDGRHSDGYLQSLLFEAPLHRAVKKLASEAKTAIEETGNNILFLCLGFLEWVDQADSSKPRLAPLYMLPVSIEKDYRKGVVTYHIQYNGEDIIQNLILREKLLQEFGLTLPDLVDPDNEDRLLTPEEYFEAVSALLARKHNDVVVREWAVRRYATLATLSLGKLLMYRDLDPRNWPDGADNLLEHDVIRRFFYDGELTASDGMGTQGNDRDDSYVLDDVADLHDDFPMIEDADSSQMSVVIDALNGKNLVVEGPPGTGKSQTITNLIAAALSQKKSVLFVAEKQAALEVVKRRMDKTGLGDFCLDLHSDKAKKRLVLDEFKQRLSNAPHFHYSHSEYGREVERYERAREKLQCYVRWINREWKQTGLTIHEILMAATRYQEAVSPLKFSDVAPESLSGDQFSVGALDDKLEQLEVFYDYLSRVSQQLPDAGNWASHPWFGVENKALSGHDPDQVCQVLAQWNDALMVWRDRLVDVTHQHHLTIQHHLSLTELDALITQWYAIPLPHRHTDIPALAKLTVSTSEALDAFVAQHQQAAQWYGELSGTFTSGLVNDLARIDEVEAALRGLAQLGVDTQTHFDDLARALTQLAEMMERLGHIETSYRELSPHLPEAIQPLLATHWSGLKELETFLSLAASLPAQHLGARDALFDNEALPEFMRSFVEEHHALVTQGNALAQTFLIDALPCVELLQQYAAELAQTTWWSWLQPSWRATQQAVRQFTRAATFEPHAMATQLSAAADWSARRTGFAEDTRNNQLLKQHFHGLDTDVDLVSTMALWYQRVRTEYGIGFGQRVALAQALFTLPVEVFRGLQSLYEHGLVIELEALRKARQRLASVLTSVECLTQSEIVLGAKPYPLTQLHESFSHQLALCQHYLLDAGLSQSQLRAQIKVCQSLRHLLDDMPDHDVCAPIFSEPLDLSVTKTGSTPAGLEVITDTLSYAAKVKRVCGQGQIAALIQRQSDPQSIHALQALGETLAQEWRQVLDAEAQFIALTGAQRACWLQHSGDGLSTVIERNQRALHSEQWLDGWLKYLFAKQRMETGGYRLLNRYLSQQPHSITFAQDAMKFATYQCLAREIYQTQPELSQMSGHEQTALQQQFAKYDEQLKVWQRRRVAARAADRPVPAGTRGAKASSYSEQALLQREIDKKTRHISIRNLVTRAGRAMLALKPCFMMSPMAVAKYLPPGQLDFDLVIMDEASQVKPQDALSCFARGKQIVVVGDSKQLPPTAFFEKSLSNDVNVHGDETGVIDEAESILDAVSAYFDKRQLRWHYRSRHGSLIEFSNHKFYHGNLVVFPSPYDQCEDYGIKFHPIEEGRFINNVNQGEAHEVVAAIKAHLMQRPHESLGIVAMNSKQRDLIEANLESAIHQDPSLRAAYLANLMSDDPLFIKNLENVQGDERDVIFISFTYGPQEKGSTDIPQRFGPINGASGWRRLNVLFTRAKQRIHVFSSMTADQIVLTDSSSLGVQSLKGYLQYAQTGHLIGQDGIQQGQPDSDFEIAVMDALAKHGFECVPQVGVAGFYIDIAVRDPGMPGRYLMGIECDGATYHSSRSTRDRDRVRQGVLEGLGWTIRRIWSTDWFKHPHAELKPIIEELKAKATAANSREEYVGEMQEPYFAEAVPEERSEPVAETLKEALVRYRDQVIARKYPKTDPNQRLLRPDMIEHLVLDRPMTREEFSLDIPGYLREHTCSKEAGDYLDDVLEIIMDYESIEAF
ncbi:DUF4011 domain-containing anti-phage protein Hhe (plasmid) [Vibrio tubiashii]|uniref:DUF4011 domain-containing anti-phage protein Hhe n=1 Tax=Vibrio tubiashii TaxID=29498 RepID=UPI003CE4D003